MDKTKFAFLTRGANLAWLREDNEQLVIELSKISRHVKEFNGSQKEYYYTLLWESEGLTPRIIEVEDEPS